MSSQPTRVAIVGAGPAGSALALFLARKGVSVTLFDGGGRPELIVGESLTPLLTAAFQKLGLEERVRAIGVYKPGVTFAFDEGNDFALQFASLRKLLPNYAYNVPRREFDQILEDAAVAAGAVIIRHAAVLERRGPDGVRLAAESLALLEAWHGEAPDFVIDASGRRRQFARLLGIGAAIGPRKDVAHFTHFEGCEAPEPAGQVIINRIKGGWSWRIPLTEGRLSIGVVINKSHASSLGKTPAEQHGQAIDTDDRLRPAVAGRRPLHDIATYTNYQLISDRGTGDGWAMVGDAFGFVDPMLSPGVNLAVTSAEQLAAAIPTHGGRTPAADRALSRYEAWFRDMLAAWQHLVEYFYDGRIFVIHRSGQESSKHLPKPLANLLERHASKHLAGMASGALTANHYSRGLLSFMTRYVAGDQDPRPFAIESAAPRENVAA